MMIMTQGLDTRPAGPHTTSIIIMLNCGECRRPEGGVMDQVEVPVLIVGGGGAGLTASMLLSSMGVPSLLVSRYAGTSILPKAHVLNQRTMEIFTELGVASEVLARSTPAENMKAAAW